MKSQLTNSQIGKRIARLRKQKGFSQDDLAKILNIPRSSVAQIESGKRNLPVTELMKLASALGFSIDKFLAREYKMEEQNTIAKEPEPPKQQMRISVPRLRIEKFRNVILYILERCGGKPNVGETVLYKLLYFSDFNYYEIYEEHLTGARYRKLPFGPVPVQLDGILNQMIGKKQIQRFKTEYHGYPQLRYIALKAADLKTFSAAEKEIIDKVIDQFSGWTARKISDYSHDDKPWRATEENDIIDYELVFYRNPPYSVREYDEDE
ncbi:MAG: DUF4065 domain-containing protein [Bacteroidales bacterium]|nr:DUF4065 domain-containing protein [Bacteroidales bacterium]MCF8351500.1 DUF4065 domain-containing protein [Bacteroidales bacterium]MCF8377732.1 DUF4065 domain-containing protein [Bacteroidales bacterium]MCF8402082.1 DUF4065 domain-containing protein [Bacteroidales bacterium]